MGPQTLAFPRRRFSNSRAHHRALISMTPLIDVVFILLVFFMLASSLLDWRSIELSAPQKAALADSAEGALLVEVRQDGILIAGESVSLSTLGQLIAQRVAQDPGQRVLVKPAQGVLLQQLVVVIDRLAASGVAAMSLHRDRPR